MTTDLALPFLTAPDPKTTQEGALDPLGLSVVADHLADLVMPGFRARMARPRFLTAMAASAAVCEGLEEEQTKDGTPAFLVLEWLIVEAFVRRGTGVETARTPGTHKARAAKESGEPMSSRAYLKVPTIFGFHGVYKPLAKHLWIVDDDLGLGEVGHDLLRAWERDRGALGFSTRLVDDKRDVDLRDQLRHAVRKNLKAGYTTQAPGWSGWASIAENLAPGRLGPAESEALWKQLVTEQFSDRAEILRHLKALKGREASEAWVVREWLMPRASRGLKIRLQAVAAFERLAGMLERSFDAVRVASTLRHAPVAASDLGKDSVLVKIARELAGAKAAADDAVAAAIGAPLAGLETLMQSLEGIRDAGTLFDALIERHRAVQETKKPNGKRPWFEIDTSGRVFVRIPYRLSTLPDVVDEWQRPYRIEAARSFIRDIQAGARA